jgi:F0F1-type ATP synthase assembly protein I
MADRKDDDASRKSQAGMMRAIGALSSVGIAFVLAVVMGFALGYGLDRLTGLRPLFTILFFFFGVAAGILNVIRTANAYGREEADERRPDHRP